MPYHHDQMDESAHKLYIPHMPHIGMRKTKSLLAVFIGFWLWQGVRIFFPELEVHPLYIYLYGIIEIRPDSDKTRELGKRRIKITFLALGIGLPMLVMAEAMKARLPQGWQHTAVELFLLLGGILLVLLAAEKANCKEHCGLACAVFLILVVSHANDEMILHAVLRAVQTLCGVFLAWLLNVKIFPYPPKPGARRFPWQKKMPVAENENSPS